MNLHLAGRKAANRERLLDSRDRSAEATAAIEAALAAYEGAVVERAHRPLRHAAHAALDALDPEM